MKQSQHHESGAANSNGQGRHGCALVVDAASWYGELGKKKASATQQHNSRTPSQQKIPATSNTVSSSTPNNDGKGGAPSKEGRPGGSSAWAGRGDRDDDRVTDKARWFGQLPVEGWEVVSTYCDANTLFLFGSHLQGHQGQDESLVGSPGQASIWNGRQIR